MKQQIDKIDPVDGICADIESQCEVAEEGLIEFSAMIAFMEGANWLGASKDAIMEIMRRHEREDGKIDYKVALNEIV